VWSGRWRSSPARRSTLFSLKIPHQHVVAVVVALYARMAVERLDDRFGRRGRMIWSFAP